MAFRYMSVAKGSVRAALVAALAAWTAGACVSTSESGGASGCEAMCQAVGASNCGPAAVPNCRSDCQAISATCPSDADSLVECLSHLSFACTGPGQLVAHSRTTPVPDPRAIIGSDGTLYVEDPACAALFDRLQACRSGSGTGGASGSSGSGGNGGSSGGAGTGGVGIDSGTGGGGTAGSGGNGGTSGGGGTGGAAVDSGAGCSADYPVACPALNGVPASCWSPGTYCNTVVACPSGDKSCSSLEGAVDCTDNVCRTSTATESTIALCTNGIDDDNNGYVDCADYSCAANPSIGCPSENTDAKCSDGVDNDNNGHIDCADYNCRMSPAVTVCGTLENDDTTCSDGIDQDNNGYADCADVSCRDNPFVTVCP